MGTRTGAVTPISTTDLRPTVSCRPTINFSLPSALGDQVHNLETFGLKAVAEHDPYISYDNGSGTGSGSGGGSGRHTPLTGLGLGLGYGNGNGYGHGHGGSGTTYLPPPKFEVPEREGGLFELLLSRDQLQIRDQGNQVGRSDYPSSGHRDGERVDQIKENQYRGGDQQCGNQHQDNRYRYRNGGHHDRILSGDNGHGQRRMDDGMVLEDQYGNGITPNPQPGSGYREDQTYVKPSQSQLITPTSTGAESLLSLLHSEPPRPPHTYRQGYHPNLNTNTNLAAGYNPPTPLTTSTCTASIPSNTTTFFKSHHAPHSVYQHGNGIGNGNGPTLPGVDQIFDLEFNRYPLSNPPSVPVQQTYSAPPSTIFPNAPHWSRQNTEVELNTAVREAHARSHVQILHPPPQILHQEYPQRSVSMASISKNRGMPTRIGFSVSPSISIASLDRGQDQDMSRESSAVTEVSLESEEGVNDDEEVLSEYRPNKSTSKKTGKGGGRGKDGKSVKSNSRSTSRPKGKGKGRGQRELGRKASGRGRPTLQPSAPIPTLYEMETVQTQIQAQHLSSFPIHPEQVQVQPLRLGNGDGGFGLKVVDCVGVGVGQIPPKLAGYRLVWEDGVAYTEDAELKQTAEVSLFF